MNIAILLGVSEYDNQDDLPSCKRDIELMEGLLRAVGKYDDNILSILENTNANSVKDLIIEKINEYSGEGIEEVFFYFTGHGNLYNNEFYFILSDFDFSRRDQTSLTNTELDNWLRSLNPKMTFKVVDACHSGMNYVKETGSLNDYLTKSLSYGTFNKCYFMFSSKSEENSYVNLDSNLGYFTESFINSFKYHAEPEIRYKNIQDYISDDFTNRSDQKPLFIMQADNTEKYCTINTEIKNLFNDAEDSPSDEGESEPIESTNLLETTIKKDAGNYYTKEAAFALLDQTKELIISYTYPGDLNSFFNITSTSIINIVDYENHESMFDVIGKWLDEHENNYFARVKIEKVPIIESEPPTKIINRVIGITVPLSEDKKEQKYSRIVKGFESKAGSPFELIHIKADPKEENLSYYECLITFVMSKTEIRFFYFFVPYKDINWDQREIDISNVKWGNIQLKYKNKDNITNIIPVILGRFSNFILNDLKDKYGLE